MPWVATGQKFQLDREILSLGAAVVLIRSLHFEGIL